jgi:hypothetical protein
MAGTRAPSPPQKRVLLSLLAGGAIVFKDTAI